MYNWKLKKDYTSSIINVFVKLSTYHRSNHNYCNNSKFNHTDEKKLAATNHAIPNVDYCHISYQLRSMRYCVFRRTDGQYYRLSLTRVLAEIRSVPYD